MNALGIPPPALRDAEALELARVWIAERGLHCSLRGRLYADAGVSGETTAWGVILADMAGHVADAPRAWAPGRTCWTRLPSVSMRRWLHAHPNAGVTGARSQADGVIAASDLG